MVKKIILDTNIIISAFGWGGTPYQLIEQIIKGKYEWIMSVKQLEEIRRVLDYPRLRFSETQKKRIIMLISKIALIVDCKKRTDAIKNDPSDNAIIEPALEMKIELIISGDKHLLNIKEFSGAKIISLDDLYT